MTQIADELREFVTRFATHLTVEQGRILQRIAERVNIVDGDADLLAFMIEASSRDERGERLFPEVVVTFTGSWKYGTERIHLACGEDQVEGLPLERRSLLRDLAALATERRHVAWQNEQNPGQLR